MIYLDFASTTPPNKEVLDVFYKVSLDYYANDGSAHKLGVQAKKLYDKSRNQIAQYLSVKSNEIFFTSGATEANNLALKGYALKYQNRGKHLITSSLEHSSVYEVFKQLEDFFGFEVTYLKCDKNGVINPSELEKAIRKDTILVSLMHVNNEIGSINELEEYGAILRNHKKIVFHVDATQSIGKIDLDIKRFGIDLLSFSAHKIYGLKGSGILYKKDSLELLPIISGGSQQSGVRPGTVSTALCVSTAKAFRLAFEKRETNYNYVLKLHSILRHKLELLPNIVFNTPKENFSPYILNFSVIDIKPETFIRAMSEEEVFISTMSACSKSLNVRSRVISSLTSDENIITSPIRISLSHLTTKEQILEVCDKIETIIYNLRGA